MQIVKKEQEKREETLARIEEKREIEAVKRSLEADRIEAKRVKERKRILEEQQTKASFVGPQLTEFQEQQRKARVKQEQQTNLAEERRVKNLNKEINRLRSLNLFHKQNLTLQEREVKQVIKKAILNAKNADELKSMTQSHIRNLNSLKKQNFLMERMKSSSKQFAGNMIGAFAIAAGARNIVQVGQDFESVRNTMLAVSSTAEESGENFKFVQEESYRLGLGLKESAKGFAKMAAARGDMSLEDTKQAFTGISEMSTLLGLSADESSRAINALQQMMSKGVVSSEELKLQMGEVLPNAIPLMAKAAKRAGLSVNGTVKEMMELQKNGQLISSKVLPFFAEELSNAARANGGLEKAMLDNRVAMNRMLTAYQMAADTFFKTDVEKGLTEFFNNSADMIKNNEILWKSLGKIVGSTLSGIAKIIKYVVNPFVSAMSSVFNFLTKILNDFSVYYP